MRKLLLATTAASLMASGIAAQDRYATVFGGWRSLDNTDFDAINNISGTLRFEGDWSTDNGYAIGAIIGQRFTPNIRGEIELSYATNDVSSFNDTSGTSSSPSVDANGSLDTLLLMANVWYDIPLEAAVTPYIGGGLGVGRVEASGVTIGGTVRASGSSTGLAGQVGFGARWALGRGMLDVGYRYQMTEYDGLDVDTIGGGLSLDNGKLYAHTLTIGYSIPF